MKWLKYNYHNVVDIYLLTQRGHETKYLLTFPNVVVKTLAHEFISH